VTIDEKTNAPDLRDRVMRSLPFDYGWIVLLAGGIRAFMAARSAVRCMPLLRRS
jgi:hypothetical protein